MQTVDPTKNSTVSSSLVSVLTINRNNSAGLHRTLACLTQQSYKAYEQIVVDGGSTDGSVDVITDPRFKVDRWVSEPDTGIYNAMNKAIRMATGRYLLFINSGDELTDAAALEMAAATVQDKDIYYFSMEIRPAKGQGAPSIKHYPEKLQFSFFYRDTPPHQSSFIKADLFTRFGMYDETLRICADWKHFMLCVCRHNCTYQYDGRTLGVFYLDGLSSDATQQQNVIAERKQVLAQEFPAFLDDTRRLYAGVTDSTTLAILRNSRTIRWLRRIGLLWKF